MKVLIPMAGEGSRFAREGYAFPKPLIDVNGKPMIQAVVENLGFKAEYVFLVRREHLEKFEGLRSSLERISGDNCKIVQVDSLTEGAACTALLAENIIDCDEDLLIANSDQVIDFSRHNFMTIKDLTDVDGIVFSFNAVHPKWSFAEVKENFVVRVAEKNPISDVATCGIYWYRKGSQFVSSAKQMIEKNIRTNNEFYIAPVYNELIRSGGKVVPFFVHKMHGIGTPEDLQNYLREIR
jgi:dTDP-glucose pyrophosphorylase